MCDGRCSGRASAFAETGTAGVRALVAVIASLFLIPAVAWGKASEAQASVPAPPKCGSTTSKRFATEVLTRNPEFVRLSKLYERWCGRARAVIRIEGSVFRISGGHCVSEFGYGLDAVKIGLIATPPATSRSWLSIDLLPPPRAGMTVKLGIRNSPPTRNIALLVVPPKLPDKVGPEPTGTVTIGSEMRSGTFLFNIDGRQVSGSWTCW